MLRLDRHAEQDPLAAQRPLEYLSVYKPRIDPDDAAHVRAVCDSLLSDIYGTDSEELLDCCYVRAWRQSRVRESIARLLKDSAAVIGADDEGNTEHFVAALARTDRLSGHTRSPIVVAGHVGAGKTTFIHRSLARLRQGAEAFFALVD